VLEFVIMTAVALLFSSFSSPVLAAVFSFSLFVIGTFAEELRSFAALVSGPTRALTLGLAYLVPNFGSLNVISSVAHGNGIPPQMIALNSLYALLYSAAVVAGAVLIFERRNFK